MSIEIDIDPIRQVARIRISGPIERAEFESLAERFLEHPEFVQKRLEAGAQPPDLEKWADARQAGLDLPEEPERIIPDEQIGAVIDVCRLAFRSDYPGLAAALDRLRTTPPPARCDRRRSDRAGLRATAGFDGIAPRLTVKSAYRSSSASAATTAMSVA